MPETTIYSSIALVRDSSPDTLPLSFSLLLMLIILVPGYRVSGIWNSFLLSGQGP